ncbi:MAG TPA: DUF2442 domain-containing protein [Elusimicrobia bacterium]|nr:DUF2442 domain-containing protein [Elusimicrobiota bacterium]HBT62337.1 DUF2442 domain-containing protein [Elusimicrobiota bacterium]
MRSSAPGKSISAVEVQDILKHGLWLYVRGEEFFLPYRLFPWFRDAKVSEVYHVTLLHGRHLYWPDLDVDLELASLRNPDKYPLVSSSRG